MSRRIHEYFIKEVFNVVVQFSLAETGVEDNRDMDEKKSENHFVVTLVSEVRWAINHGALESEPLLS